MPDRPPPLVPPWFSTRSSWTSASWTHKTPNNSEYAHRFSDTGSGSKGGESAPHRTLYQSLDPKTKSTFLGQTQPTEAETSAQMKTLCQLTDQMNQQPDYLTAYQVEFNQEQKAQAAKRQAQRECSATGFVLQDHKESINRVHGLKTTGKMDLGKHDKNVSNLYYLFESQTAKDLGLADPIRKVNMDNSDEHFQFGTYHWKRCEVTKNFHPGLCYR